MTLTQKGYDHLGAWCLFASQQITVKGKATTSGWLCSLRERSVVMEYGVVKSLSLLAINVIWCTRSLCPDRRVHFSQSNILDGAGLFSSLSLSRQLLALWATSSMWAVMFHTSNVHVHVMSLVSFSPRRKGAAYMEIGRLSKVMRDYAYEKWTASDRKQDVMLTLSMYLCD